MPGLTEQTAVRVAENREPQATYAVPTGPPPPPPPEESAGQHSGANPKMAEDKYCTEWFRGRAEARRREERARWTHRRESCTVKVLVEGKSVLISCAPSRSHVRGRPQNGTSRFRDPRRHARQVRTR